MMVYRGGWVAIAPKLLVKRDLVRVEQGAGFEMCCQMDRPQPPLQFGYRGRLSRKPIRRDITLRE